MGFDDPALNIHVSPNDRAEFSPYKIYYGSFIDKDGNEDMDIRPTPEIKDQAAKTAQWIAGHGDSVKCVILFAGIDYRKSTEYALMLGDRLGDAAKQLLVANGINRNYIVSISTGKEKANPLFYADGGGKLAHNFNNYVSIAVVLK